MRLTREEAAAKAAALGLAPYDALLDGYEPGLTSRAIDALFAPLAEFLPEFPRAGAEPPAGPPADRGDVSRRPARRRSACA